MTDHLYKRFRKRPKLMKFNPDREYLEKKIAEWKAAGGEIKQCGDDRYNPGRTTRMQNFFYDFTG